MKIEYRIFIDPSIHGVGFRYKIQWRESVDNKIFEPNSWCKLMRLCKQGAFLHEHDFCDLDEAITYMNTHPNPYKPQKDLDELLNYMTCIGEI